MRTGVVGVGGGKREVQHDQKKPPPSQGFYTKVRVRDTRPSTSPPSQPCSTALFSEAWQKIASQVLLRGVWVKVGGWESGRDRAGTTGRWGRRVSRKVGGDGDGDAVTFNHSLCLWLVWSELDLPFLLMCLLFFLLPPPGMLRYLRYILYPPLLRLLNLLYTMPVLTQLAFSGLISLKTVLD